MIPTHARIVIIGGGAIGCSIAYHLSQMGERDVVLLEKSGLTHGATWHAAGLVGQLRSKRNLTRLMQNSVELYGRLEQETGQAIEWHPAGSLRLASSEARWSELKRSLTTARSFNFEIHALSPKEAQDKFPLITLDGIVGAVFIPTDGYVDPSSLTQALAKGARSRGRQDPRRRARHRLHAQGPPDHADRDQPGHDQLRNRRQRGGHVGARDRQDGRRARARRRGRAPVHDHGEDRTSCPKACRRCAIPTRSSI